MKFPIGSVLSNPFHGRAPSIKFVLVLSADEEGYKLQVYDEAGEYNLILKAEYINNASSLYTDSMVEEDTTI